MLGKQIAMLSDFDIPELRIKELDYGGYTYRYSVGGCGRRNLLILLSNYAGEYLSLPIMQWLRNEYHMIAFSMPIAEFANGPDGIHAVLEAESVESCDVFGCSMGSFHAQNFILNYPGMVEKIVFSNAETAISIEQDQKEFGGYKKALSLLRSLLCIIPANWILQKLSQRFFKTLKMETPEQTNQVIRLVQDVCRTATRTECANILSDMIDSIDHALLFYPQAYEKKVDQILIIDSKDDRAIPKNIKAAMYRLCPGAKTYHFETGGHTPMFTRAAEYKKILLDFLLS